METEDPREHFVLSAIADFFESDRVSIKTDSKKALAKFLDTSCMLLLVQSDEHQSFTMTNKVEDLTTGRTLIFTKKKTRPVRWPDDQSDLLLFPISEHRGDSLDQLFSKIHDPIIQHAKALGDNGSLLMTSLVNQLSDKMNGFSEANVGSPDSELQYWNHIAKKSNELYERKRASAFAQALGPIAKELENMDSVRLSELEDSANTILGLIDDLWKLDDYQYPQDRMERLLNISGVRFVEAVAKKLQNAPLWTDTSTDRSFHLEQALACCNAWFVECHRLTSLFWKNDADHQWQGEPYQSLYVLKLRDRIRQITAIRDVVRLSSQLLSPSKQYLLEPKVLFQSFQEMDTTMHNSLTESSIWKSAVALFNERVVEVEKEVCDVLRPKLDSAADEPANLLDIFLEYQELIERPRIKDQLIPQCQTLMKSLKTWLKKLQNYLVNNSFTESDEEIPETLQEIYAARQLETYVMKILKAVQIFLHDQEEAQTLQMAAETLLNEVKEQTREIFDTWSRNMLSGIRDHSLSLSSDSPVVSFDKNQLMQINYDSRFVHLAREVKLLSSMGFKIAPEIHQNSRMAEDFMQHAKDLEQIADFHNNIGDSIIPCLKPLMLEAAMGISSLVQEQNVVKWTQTDMVANYVRRLQAAVQRLAVLNQQLSQCHDQIREKIIKLFDVDLLTQQQIWKDQLKEIRLIMGTIEAQGFTHLQAWRQFWDYQLYKALESQYQSHFHRLHATVPDIHIELEFKKQQLTFRPPMEEIRREYYGRIRKFIALPLNFKGLFPGNAVNIFPRMVERQAKNFGTVFTGSSRMFVELEEYRNRQISLIAPALADFDALLTDALEKADDWEAAFLAAKKRRTQFEELESDDEKIGCFVISSSSLYRELEYLHRRFWDALTSSLYVSIHNDIREVETFTENGTALLEGLSKSDDAFSEANAQLNHLLSSSPEMGRVMRRIDSKVKVLTRWSNESVDSYNQIQLQWKAFNDLLATLKEKISQQMDELKSSTQMDIMNLTSQVEQFHQHWMDDRTTEKLVKKSDNKQEAIEKCIAYIRKKREEWNELMEMRQNLNNKLERVGENPVELSVVPEIENDLQQHEQVWSLYEKFAQGLDEMGNEEWVVFRNKIPKLDEYLENSLQTVNEAESERSFAVIPWLRSHIESYKAFIPLLKLLRGETFTERHWFEALNLAGIPAMPIERILLKQFLESREQLMNRHNDLKELNGRAAGESQVRQALSELEQWDIETRWTLSNHVDSNGKQVSLIKEYKELLNKVGENLSLIQSVKDSTYYQAYSDRITLWETKMTDLDFLLRHLSQIQLKWLYLEPVFNRGTVMKDAGRFRRLDADFRNILSQVQRDPQVTSLLRISNLRSIVTNLLDQVGRCQKSLYEFLEEKRSKFARFYFIGDEDLLDIIGQATSKPAVIQSHLKKLFAGIHSVVFDADDRRVTAVSSLEGERVPLRTPISVDGDVEVWLNHLVDATSSTLRALLGECLAERRRGDDVDVSRYPSQVLCLAEAIVFSEACERVIPSRGLDMLLADYKKQLASYTTSCQQNEPDDGVTLLKLQSLIMDVIHYIDIIEQLIEAQCRALDDWCWQKQLRFYCPDGVTVARMAGTDIEYTYEYQGNVAKLVHTPLTDKCYLTLTLALRMGLGGNPYGPAGTGKTESVKALGSLLGRQVLVFNCDEGLDVKAMGRIFIGLAKSGAWGCFDEFNRLDENTLSTVSTLIQAIQTALKNRNESVTLLGSQVGISPHTGIYVTLNPAGKEYGGRQKLPDNLKLLFRPVVMSQPDIELIAEVILFSQGFRTAKVLGKKLVEVFRLAQKLLSRQQHYDWGLRALKSVLRTAGEGLRSSQSEDSDANLEQAESLVVVRALNFNTLSKLTRVDSTLFLGLVDDMFPECISHLNSTHSKLIQLKINETHSLLIQVITDCYQEMGLVFLDRQVKKVLEVYEQLKQRMGVVIVGPPQTGKSTVCSILKKVLKKQRKVYAHTLNPKSISRVQLLGSIDSATREWTDGVLTKVARLVVEDSDVISWVVFDGDIDPEWVESLNSVLDDNRLLTMASGERIKFGPNVNFIFETHDLTYASPATVSRMGVIYFSEDDIDFQALINHWLTQQPDESQDFLRQCIQEYVYQAIQWITKNGEPVVPVSTVTIVRSILSHLGGSRSKTQFISGLLKGGGANLTSSSRNSFGKMVLGLSKINAPDPEHPCDSTYDPNADALIELNAAEFDQTVMEEESEIFRLLVPTSNLHFVSTVIEQWLERKEHVLLVGPESSGKSLLLEHCLRQMRSTRLVTVHCTADTTPYHVLHQLMQNSIVISSSGGQVLCPREASMLVLYLKDLNIVVPDKWGTCQLIAFLEQIINYEGCYDNQGEWLVLKNIQLVCSLNLEHGQGRFPLSSRFTSLIHVVSVAPPHPDQLETIANRYLSNAVEREGHDVHRDLISKMASFMVHFDKEVKANVSSDLAFVTLFTLRQLTNWTQTIARYEIQWTDKKAVAEALAYEACRIYRDKLQSEEQRSRFDAVLANLFSEVWKTSVNPVGSNVYTTQNSKSLSLVPMSLVEWEKRMQKTEQQYGREYEALDIEMLPELLLTVAYADRVLSSPQNSLLLVGRSGVGRHTVVKLLSVIHRCRVFTPQPAQNYSRKQFTNDLKGAMFAAGIDGDPVFFILEDFHFTEVAFYAMMDSLLASGEVAGIYSNEELDVLLSPLKEIAAQEGHRSSLFTFFSQRVKRNFHAVFIMDKTQPSFENLVETHPCLYKYSDSLWVDNWSSNSMMLVAKRIILQDMDESEGEAEKITSILNNSMEIYEQLDSTFQSPRSYVSFIRLFAKTANTKKCLISKQKHRIQVGVTKMSEARSLVNRLQTDAGEQEKLLEQKQLEAKSALQKITDTIKSAGTKRGELQTLRSTIAQENEALVERKKGIDQEMAEIEPLLAEARSAVSDIRNEALSEIRSLRAPPDAIRDILEGVLRLMGILDTSWTSMKSFLAKRGIKEEIR